MLDIKAMIGILVGAEPEPELVIRTGDEFINGTVINYGEDSIMVRVDYITGEHKRLIGYSMYIIPYAHITSISKYYPLGG